MQLYNNFSLINHNTFRINVKAEYFASVDRESSVRELLTDMVVSNQKVLTLGGGSNILFTDDFNGLVIHNSIKGIRRVEEDEDTVLIEIGGGVIWEDLIDYTLENNYSGIENLTLIPGQAGAAPIQNIGAYGVELKDTFHSLDAVDIKTGKKEIFYWKDCEFGYRYSVFKAELKDQFIITSVRLKLNKNFIPKIDYSSLQEAMKGKDPSDLTMHDVVKAVRDIRNSKLPKPEDLPNAGSFFKNPEVDKNELDKIKEEYPNVPSFDLGKNKFKIPAAWLIEKAGLKGKRIGDVGTHEKQALVIVNYGNASGNDILQFARMIKEKVYNKFNIILEPEVNII
jgi:UDP-N-acetylmuramate dehydrogenase